MSMPITAIMQAGKYNSTGLALMIMPIASWGPTKIHGYARPKLKKNRDDI
jgi:hypothetical protein